MSSRQNSSSRHQQMAPVALHEAEAAQTWRDALKSRSHVQRHIDRIKKTDPSNFDLDVLDRVDVHMSYFRLACVRTIFLDIEYAEHEKASHILWDVHGSVRAIYRHLIRGTERVNRSHASRKYLAFLSTSRKFYKTLIQRLSTRFDVPELRQAARGIRMPGGNDNDCISPVDASIAQKAVSMCWAAVLILGDITRYIADEGCPELLDKARFYYDLAHQLRPDHGHPFHQMALIRSNRRDYAEVLYNFYRAMVTTVTHPAAEGNLTEFFETLQSPTFRTSSTDALGMWLCKLHAFFFKGQPFKQQQQLETEVIHKLQEACRDETAGLKLLKLSLINISAEYIASSKLHLSIHLLPTCISGVSHMTADAQSGTESLPWHFNLQFNSLWIRTICRALVSELEDVMVDSSDADSCPAQITFTETIQNLLAVMRLYSIWLCGCNSLHGSHVQFKTIAFDLATDMSSVFTLVCRAFDSKAYVPCPYLLPEDILARGVLPIEGPHVPSDCRLFNDGNGSTKVRPLRKDPGIGSVRENQERIFGIITCAYVLHKSSALVNFRFEQGVAIFEPLRDATTDAPRTETQDLNHDDSLTSVDDAVANCGTSFFLEPVSVDENDSATSKHRRSKSSLYQWSHDGRHDENPTNMFLDPPIDAVSPVPSTMPIPMLLTTQSPMSFQEQPDMVLQYEQHFPEAQSESPWVPIAQGLPRQCTLDFLWDPLPFPSYSDEKAAAIRSAFVQQDDNYFSDEDDNVFLYGRSASTAQCHTAKSSRGPLSTSQQDMSWPQVGHEPGMLTHAATPSGNLPCPAGPCAAPVDNSIIYHNFENDVSNNRFCSLDGMSQSCFLFDADAYATASRM